MPDFKKPKYKYDPAPAGSLMKGDPISGWNPRAIKGATTFIEDARKSGVALDGSDFHGVGPNIALKKLLKKRLLAKEIAELMKTRR